MELQINLFCGLILRWKKRTFILEESGYRIFEKKENGIISEKEYKLIPLFGGKIIESKTDNLEFTIETPSVSNLFKANSLKEKTILIEKIEDTIRKVNEKNAFSKDYFSYTDELDKNENNTTFNSLELNISFLQNCILAITSEINDLKNNVNATKMKIDNKCKLVSNYTNLGCVSERLKNSFDEMVRLIYDYREETEANGRTSNGKISSLEMLPVNEKKENNTNNNITKQKIKESRVFFDNIYGFPKRTQLPRTLTASKNMIAELIKAVTTKQRTLPVYFNEPISFLQKDCEKFYYSGLLSKAASQPTTAEKMLQLSAFIIGEISFNSGRILKPFMPLIGETFEYIDNERHYRYFSEQVSRRPQHISAFIAEGDKWKMYGDNRNTNSFKFLKGCMELEFGSKVHVELLDEEKDEWEAFVFNKPTTQMKGIITKTIHYDFTGSVKINSVKNKDCVCEITFIEEKKDSPIGLFEGKITENGNVVYLLGGNWKKEVYYTDKDGNGKNILLEIKKEKFFDNDFDNYVMPEYTCNFNEINDDLKNILPICDSRFRPDQREYEIGNIDKAQEIKAKLEEKQVKRQEKFDNVNYEYKPHYFSNEYSDDSGDFVYLYLGGYWEDRSKKNYSHLTDIFQLDYDLDKESDITHI